MRMVVWLVSPSALAPTAQLILSPNVLHTDLQVIEVVLGLISDSLDNWRTRQYDAYQRVLNSIL